jgi:hypothetical protein
MRLGKPLVGVVAAFGISASCGTDERAGRKPDIAEERDAGTDAISMQDASTDLEGDHSRADSMTADAGNCDDIPSISHDAGDPPPDCIPPCIWRVLRNCLPKGPCGTENGWRRECVPRVGGACCSDFVDGARCFSISVARAGAGPGLMFWGDGEAGVAWALRDDYDNGRYTVDCCANVSECDAGSEAYAVDPTADHCAPWQEVPWQRAWAPGGQVPNQNVCDEL